MFRHQVMFVILFSILLLTFAQADTIPITGGTNDIGPTKTTTDFQSMMSNVVHIVMKQLIGDSTGPLNLVKFLHERIVSAKKSENELYEKYEKILRKKESFEELQKKVNQISSVKTTEEIKQKLTEVQTTASKGFQKLNEIEKMKADVKRAIHEYEIENKNYIAYVNKSFLLANSLLLGSESEMKNTIFSTPAFIAEFLSSFSSAKTCSDRLSDILEKYEKSSTEAEKNVNGALKELQEIEAAQKAISAMKQPLALGVKDAHGTIIKDSTSVPSLLSNFACFAGVMMLKVMSTDYL